MVAIAEKIGSFRIVSPIARGGMGRVFLARQEKTGQRIAVKVLPEKFLNDRKRYQYLEREVKITRKLKHPNVIDIYGLHQENGMGYLVMEYMSGGNTWNREISRWAMQRILFSRYARGCIIFITTDSKTVDSIASYTGT
jgi:serine/threonine protein kinase